MKKLKFWSLSTKGRIALEHPGFRHFSVSRFLSLSAHQMLAVAVAQDLYVKTNDPLHLGYIGLSLFLPKICFTLIAGHAADIFDRKKILILCRWAHVILGSIFIIFHIYHLLSPTMIYSLLFLMGTSSAFDGPASQAVIPQLVPTEHFSNAIAWNSSMIQLAFITGPALGGFVYALYGQPLPAYILTAFFRLLALVLVLPVHPRPHERSSDGISWKSVLAGLDYVIKNKMLLGIISLDLFAVLLGGAVALLPVFANDILKVSSWGLGLLRAAPSVGAAVMAISIAHLPPMKKAGRNLLWAIGIFGVCTILFALSKNFYLSLGLLFLLGAADMISVFIRGVLVQLKTPESMRGRVSAVNMIFIGASNELGEFESGATARLMGTIPAVVFGGVGTLLIVFVWSYLFPEIRKFEKM